MEDEFEDYMGWSCPVKVKGQNDEQAREDECSTERQC